MTRPGNPGEPTPPPDAPAAGPLFPEPGKPKVLLLAGTGFLGAYAGILYLARELTRQGCDLTVWVSGPPAERALYEALGIRVIFHPFPKAHGIRLRLQALRRRFVVLRLLLRHRRVVVAEETFLLEAAITKAWLGRKCRHILYAQELQLYRDFPHIRKLRFREFLGLARSADMVVDVEPNRARARCRELRLARAPLVLRNTLPLSALPARAPAGTLAAMAGVVFPPGVPILLHMGGIGREKPFERLLDAVAGCNGRVFLLAFCNAAPEEVELLRLQAATKLAPGSYALLDPRSRQELLASAWEADAGVIDYSPSVENSHNQRFCAPTKLYEFMALGLAVVGSDNESLRAIIEPEGIGYCAESGGTEALSRTIARVLLDPEALHAMKTRGPAVFRARHSYETLCVPVVRDIVRILQS